jgi:hypothetical protein
MIEIMTTETTISSFTHGPGEKACKVMLYLTGAVYWGTVVVKEQLRVSTWLRTQAAPEFIDLNDGRAMITTSGTQPQPIPFSEIHVPTEQIIGIHLIPPDKEPLDFDASEPNRIMVPTSIILGSFLIRGFMRMSSLSNLQKYLDITRETYTPFYDADITNLIMQSLGCMHVPFLLVRKSVAVFSMQSPITQTEA